ILVVLVCPARLSSDLAPVCMQGKASCFPFLVFALHRPSAGRDASTAGWQSGYAAACKAVDAGSIPTPASNLRLLWCDGRFVVRAVAMAYFLARLRWLAMVR